MHSKALLSLAVSLGCVLFCRNAAAQQADAFGLIDGSILFIDEESDSRCAAVNTFNADFFIRSCDRRLVLLSGDDRLTPYVVDQGFNVTDSTGGPAGAIRFATDNDGVRQVFWLSDDSFAEGPDLVLNYISETDTLAVATVAGQEGEQIPLSPINISQTECDPLASFDGGDELLCPRTCGVGAAGAGLMLTVMLGLAAVRGGRAPKQRVLRSSSGQDDARDGPERFEAHAYRSAEFGAARVAAPTSVLLLTRTPRTEQHRQISGAQQAVVVRVETCARRTRRARPPQTEQEGQIKRARIAAAIHIRRALAAQG